MKKQICQLSTLLITIGLFSLISCNGQPASSDNSTENSAPETEKIPHPAQPRMDSVLAFGSNVRVIFEDSKGNMWFGTDREGVCVFNGVEYAYFSDQEGLRSNQVWSIQEDQQGNIWVGGANGVSKYDGVSFWHYPELAKANESNTSKEYQLTVKENWEVEPSDLIFEGVYRGGVYHYDGEEMACLDYPFEQKESDKHSFDPYWTFSSYRDSDGNLWMGTVSKGVIKFGKDQFQVLDKKDLNVAVRSIYQDNNGDMWFGNNGGGVYHYDGEVLTNITEENGLSNYEFLREQSHDYTKSTLARVWAITQDDEGNMWFGTVDNGAWKYDGTNFTRYMKEDGLPHHSISTIFKDSDGILWFGTALGGVGTFDGELFKVMSTMKATDGC